MFAFLTFLVVINYFVLLLLFVSIDVRTSIWYCSNVCQLILENLDLCIVIAKQIHCHFPLVTSQILCTFHQPGMKQFLFSFVFYTFVQILWNSSTWKGSHHKHLQRIFVSFITSCAIPKIESFSNFAHRVRRNQSTLKKVYYFILSSLWQKFLICLQQYLRQFLVSVEIKFGF